MYAFICLFLSLLFSCGGGAKSDTSSISWVMRENIASETEDARLLPSPHAAPGGTLRMALSRAPTGFLSYSNNFSPSNEFITQQMLLPLLERHPIDESIRGALAENWAWQNNGHTFKLTLREHLYWSDGTPLSAKDVLFTFKNIILNPASPANYLEVFSYNGIVSEIIATDDRHIEFRLPAPLTAIPYTLTYLPILPAHKISPQQASPDNLHALWNTSTLPADMPASGPFILKKYQPGVKITLQRNPYFFRTDSKGHRLPYAHELELYVVPHTSARMAMFAAGQLDYFEPSPQDFLLLQKQKNSQGKYQLFHGRPAKNHPSVTHIAFNFDAPNAAKAALFRSLDFRIAMEYLLNRLLIISQVYQGLARVQGTFITEQNQQFYDAQSDAMRRGYHPGKAKDILHQLGLIDRNGDGWRDFPDGSPLVLSIVAPTGTLTQKEADIALLYSMSLNEAGIQTILQKLDGAAMMDKIKRTDFDIVLRSIANSPDPLVRVRVIWQPGQFLYYFHPSTYDKENNKPNAQAMMDWEKLLMNLYEQANITHDEKIRKEYYAQIQRIYAEYLPVIFTVRQDNLYAAQKDIANVALTQEGLLAFSTWTAAKNIIRP